MAVDRRISATFKDLPGGQVLGPTFDYTHRLLDFALMAEGGETGPVPPTPPMPPPAGAPLPAGAPHPHPSPQGEGRRPACRM